MEVDDLPLNAVLAIGTHNSSHVETVERPEWDFTHPPLAEQVALGVRQFELDVWWDNELGDFDVYHIPILDQGVNCLRLTGCLADLAGAIEPDQIPLTILIEVKDAYDPDDGPSRLAALDAAVMQAFGPLGVFVPEDLLGEAPDLAAAAEAGWPRLAAVRGKAWAILHADGAWRDAYTDNDTSVAGAVLWADGSGDTSVRMAAFHAMNDPFNPSIASVVEAGGIVRTRADGDVDEAANNDTAQRDAALASGAHFVSTDFPTPHPTSGYVVTLPDGVACNPVAAPPDCTPDRIEGPQAR